jgi:hypothetical protein
LSVVDVAAHCDSLWGCFGANAAVSLSFSERLLFVAEYGGEQIIDDLAGTGLDLDGDGHAGGEVDEIVVDLHLRLAE